MLLNQKGFIKGLKLTADFKVKLEKELSEQEIISEKDLPKFNDKAEVKGVTNILAWIVTGLVSFVGMIAILAASGFIAYLIAGPIAAVVVASLFYGLCLAIPDSSPWLMNAISEHIVQSIFYPTANIINIILGKKNPYSKEVVEEVKEIQSSMHKILSNLAVDEKALEKFNQQYDVGLKLDKYYNFVRNALFLRSFVISEIIKVDKGGWLDGQQVIELIEIAIEDFWSKLPKEKRQELIKNLASSDNVTYRRVKNAIKDSAGKIWYGYGDIYDNARKAVSKVLEEECNKNLDIEAKKFMDLEKLKHDVVEVGESAVMGKISKIYYSGVDKNVREVVAEILKEEYKKRLGPEFRNFIKSGILSYEVAFETDESLKDSIRKSYEAERNKVSEGGKVIIGSSTKKEMVPRVDRVINAERDVQDFYVRKLKEERKKAPSLAL